MAYLSDPPLRFEPSINFPVPDTKSVIQCVKLLQLVKYVLTIPRLRVYTNND